MTRFCSHAIPWLLAPFLVVTALLSGAGASTVLAGGPGRSSGIVGSLGYGSLSVLEMDLGIHERWSILDGTLGIFVLSGNLQFLLGGMISPSRTYHVPDNGWRAAHKTSEFFWGPSFRTRGRVYGRAYAEAGIGFIDQMWSSDTGMIRESDEVTGDWTWGGDVEVLRLGNTGLLLGVQFHNFFVEAGGSRPDFSLTTFQVTGIFR